LAAGFLGPAWAHSHWSNTIGGKPVIALPPFIVIMFELTILFGALATLAGLFLLTRLPSHKMLDTDEHYDARCTEDHYALYVQTTESKRDTVLRILKEEGAEVRT
jgi:molybdopterin-containing oxidoreductase family membrane subunit